MRDQKRNWKKLLKKHGVLQLPAAGDALTAKLIQQAGFPAYQIGGFALDGLNFGYPDMDVTRLGEKSTIVRDILQACPLPVLIDCDDGYGDEKNVVHTVHTYDDMGAWAIFIEDQKAPKRCGHMAGKEVIPAREMVNKIRAAAGARSSRTELFLIARTDAREPEGLNEALRRGEKYLNAGADGIYIEGPHDRHELRTIGRAFKGVPLVVTILERGGKTPWFPPEELQALGFSMILYPTTLLFRMTRSLQRGLVDLKRGIPLSQENSVDMLEFERIAGIAYWKSIEAKSLSMPERLRQGLNRLFTPAA